MEILTRSKTRCDRSNWIRGLKAWKVLIEGVLRGRDLKSYFIE